MIDFILGYRIKFRNRDMHYDWLQCRIFTVSFKIVL